MAENTCVVYTHLERNKQEFRANVSRFSTVLDLQILYAQLLLDAVRVQAQHEKNCFQCRTSGHGGHSGGPTAGQKKFAQDGHKTGSL